MRSLTSGKVAHFADVDALIESWTKTLDKRLCSFCHRLIWRDAGAPCVRLTPQRPQLVDGRVRIGNPRVGLQQQLKLRA